LKQKLKPAEIMDLIYGEVVDLDTEKGMKMGSGRVSAAIKKVALYLVPEARRGDKVLPSLPKRR
jgi:hypothetical protein